MNAEKKLYENYLKYYSEDFVLFIYKGLIKRYESHMFPAANVWSDLIYFLLRALIIPKAFQDSSGNELI